MAISNIKNKFNERLSSSVRPQGDFYRYVNGRWIQRTSIPPELSIWGTFYELTESNFRKIRAILEELKKDNKVIPKSIEQKVRDFYLSASSPRSETLGLKKVTELYHEIDKAVSKTELVRLIGRFHLMDVGCFWDVYIERDDKNSSQYILRLGQSGLSLPDRQYYVSRDAHHIKLRQKLASHIPKMFNKIEYKDISTQIGKNIIKLETNLAKPSMSATELRDVKAMYNKMSFAKLKKIAPGIDWATYFSGLGIDPPSKLIVDQLDFFKQVSRIYDDTDIDALKDYLKWHTLKTSSPFMGERMARIHFDFFGKSLYGTKNIRPLWQRAIMTIDTCIGEALGQLYIDKFFPPEANKKIGELVEDIRSAFRLRMQKLAWMDSRTKNHALKKLNNIRIKVGHPRKLRKYGDVKIVSDSFLDNYLSGKIAGSKRHLTKLGRPIDPDEWFMSPQTVNAYFHQNANEIVFPAGILQPPFFNFRADPAVNYGGIGAVIGHELTHGFDDKGSLYDAKGNLRNWWDQQTKRAFNRGATRIIDQANKHEVLPGKKLQGKLTAGENIADLGGAEIAFDAMSRAIRRHGDPGRLEGFTQAQRFFLNLALCECRKSRKSLQLNLLITDPHAPGEFRTNNTLRNMDAFYEAFDIKPGDKMYIAPNRRVKIW